MKFYSFSVLSLVLTCLLSHAQAQDPEQRRIKVELLKLRDYSLNYDIYSGISKRNKEYIPKRDSAEVRYENQIKLIKFGPQKDQFLAFLNRAIEIDSALYRNIGYNYTRTDDYLTEGLLQKPTLLEYYKAVRYSLFEKDSNRLLPMEDIPFLRYKLHIPPRLEKVPLPGQ